MTTIIQQFLSQPTLLGFLIIFVLIGGFLQWWVYGPQYQREVARADKAEGNAGDWEKIAMSNAELAKQATANNEVMLAIIRAFRGQRVDEHE